MNNLPKFYGIIPARYASKRFNGKPLAMILAKPMFWHVYERARKCPELSQVVIATDDDRIASNAKELNVPVIMTRNDHISGTDRVLEAAEIIGVPEDAVVVNIQGDEPTFDPAMLSELVQPFESDDINVTTLARKISPKEAENPDFVKVVFAKDHKALYFSRSPVPASRDGKEGELYGHIGLYAFRMRILRQFVILGPSRLETIEKLEQLRLLENGIPIHVVTTNYISIGVDRPEDIKTVSKILQEKN
ncbi:MAG: 3-deoxy-manno-octulosonate cytidylyltransferase [Deltaproteobacteria bacterium]|nr:MAG: 3-deoxy-manno-octulosonate cytidylyltransferase [Deltaproteobacteria bacterium]